MTRIVAEAGETNERPARRGASLPEVKVMRNRLYLIALIMIGMVAPAIPAQATFPGRDGTIAFRRFFNDDRTWGAVFTIRPDGSHERQITSPPVGFVDRNPDVSPDGRTIAFQREGADCSVNCNYQQIFVVNIDGTGLRELTRQIDGTGCGTGGTCNFSPAWSPDGRRIAFERASGPFVDDLDEIDGIYVMNADGTHVRQVTEVNEPRLGGDGEPQWSPDGKMILFQRRNIRGALPADGLAIWTLNLRTGTEFQVTPYALRAGDTPDWSPDGRHILFHDNNDVDLEVVSANLYTIRPDGTDLHQLTFAQNGDLQYLGSSYSPDGRFITFGRRPATGGTNADVYIMRADGTHIEQVTKTKEYDSYPDWGSKPRGRH